MAHLRQSFIIQFHAAVAVFSAQLSFQVLPHALQLFRIYPRVCYGRLQAGVRISRGDGSIRAAIRAAACCS